MKAKNLRIKVRRSSAQALAELNACLLSRYSWDAGPVLVSAYCVWRRKNEDSVRAMVEQLPSGSAVHLHCLDDGHMDSTLAEFTRNCGPGLRMPLLQALIDGHPPDSSHWLLVFDDDVVFPRRDLGRFISLAAIAGLDLAQPAHLPKSASTFPVTRAHMMSLARLTRFVEVGPVVLASPSVRAELLPFPHDMGMGWGLDVEWSTLVDRGYRLGVVDATPVMHTGAVGTDYSRPEEEATLADRLHRVGAKSSYEVAQGTSMTWRPWQRAGRWTDALGTAEGLVDSKTA